MTEVIQDSDLFMHQDHQVPLPEERPATIYDVARAAGVSLGTASKALNGRGKLSVETRARVRAAATQLEFRPNELMLSLQRGRSYTIGMLTTIQDGRFNTPLITGIEDAMMAANVSVFLCVAVDDPAREHKHIQALLAKQVDGIIVTGGRTDPRPPIDLGRSRVPILYAYPQTSDPSALCLLPDDAQGARLATEHLIREGRRRIAHITGPWDWDAVVQRYHGMRQTLADFGLPLLDQCVLAGWWKTAEWGRQAVEALLNGAPTVDAIFCGSDLIAWGVIDTLWTKGICVPDDVAVVGFDNHEVIAESTRPPLTTVDMRLQDLGRIAGQRMLDMINGKRESGLHRFPCQLVVRESCGHIPTKT